MAYRNNAYPLTHDPDAARSLERFALVGRERRDCEREREQRAQRRHAAKAARREARAARRRARDQARRRARSATRAGVFTHLWLMMYLGANAVCLAPLVYFTDAGLFWRGVVATLAAIPLLVWLGAVGLSRRGLRREVAWLESRPFPVTGHLRTLGADAHRFRATVEFVGDAPTEGLVRDVITAAALDAPSRTRKLLLRSREEIELGEGAVRITMPDGGHGLFQHDNFAYRRWLRAVVDRVAVRLHPVYPVARVAASA